jgi:hypothetical protein
MDENENLLDSGVSDTGDDWDDVDLSGIVNDEDEDEESTADQPETEETPKDEPKAETPPEKEVKTEVSDRKFTLKHLDKTQEVDETEVISLAQKGLDYDRIRQQRDELTKFKADNAAAMQLIEEAAKEQGLTVSDLVFNIRVQKHMQDAEAKGTPLTEKEARLSLENLDLKAKQNEASLAKNAEEARRKADIDQFFNAYNDEIEKGEIDPAKLPIEVWDMVNKGLTLVAAYAKYENQKAKAEAERLKAELEIEKQNTANKQKSVGSQASEGQKDKKGIYDALWYDGT